MTVQTNTQAQAFVETNNDYLFNDAHYLVEAQASVEAKEIAYNTFRFADGSILKLGRLSATCHPAPVQ